MTTTRRHSSPSRPAAIGRVIGMCVAVASLWFLPGPAARGQSLPTPWIGSPTPDGVQHLWFRQTYLDRARPRQARLRVVTTGVVKAYINACNVTTKPHFPARTGHDDAPHSEEFDVTALMRPDTNVVALVFAPTHATPMQVAVTLYGTDHEGRPFCHQSDDTWLCRAANSAITPDGGERIDGRLHTTTWRETVFDLALWRHAVTAPLSECLHHVASGWTQPARRVVRRRRPDYFDRRADGVEYEFGTGFQGMVRLTLRDARPGSIIRFGRMAYVCSGTLDEQAAPVFLIDDYRRVAVTSDRTFDRQQITDIEGIETALTAEPANP